MPSLILRDLRVSYAHLVERHRFGRHVATYIFTENVYIDTHRSVTTNNTEGAADDRLNGRDESNPAAT